METLEIKVRKIYYSNGNWSSVMASQKLTGQYFRAAGTIYEPEVGSDYIVYGEWIEDEKYGTSFKVIRSESCMMRPSKDGIISFLSSGFVKGIGVKKANRIYSKFGDKTYEVIEKDPLKLTEIKGITAKTALSIQKSYLENSEFRRLREFLPPDVSDGKVRTLYCKYKGRAIATLKDNPYLLIKDIEGVGFKTADRIAKSLGITAADSRRVNAGIVYCLRLMESDGHCFTYAKNLYQNVSDLICDEDRDNTKVPASVVADEIKKLVDEKTIIIDSDGAIYYKSIYNAERGCANKVIEMIKSKPSQYVSYSTIEEVANAAKVKNGFEIEPMQLAAVQNVFANTFSIITGGPGTGKSTITKLILDAYFEEYPDGKVALAAPTGKAARRLSEVTERTANTIHQLLRYKATSESDSNEFEYNEKNPLPYDFIIIDEASMLDIHLAWLLLRGVPSTARIVFIGDIDQLPPIGPGNFFRDLVKAYNVPTIKLQFSFRQKGYIAENARLVNEGKGVHAFHQDDTFSFIKATPENIQQTVIKEYLSLVREYGVENCCILSPMRKKSSTATNTLNRILQDTLNPKIPGQYVVVNKNDGSTFRVGDRVMQTVNHWDKDVANGDTGFITSIEDGCITVLFDSGVEAEYTSGAGSIYLTLAYAITVHKAQGSEYKGCVVALNSEHWYMAQRAILYTAITRAKEKECLIGDPRTIARAATNVSPVARNTKLYSLVTNIVHL